jgi:hypothetical protein
MINPTWFWCWIALLLVAFPFGALGADIAYRGSYKMFPWTIAGFIVFYILLSVIILTWVPIYE